MQIVEQLCELVELLKSTAPDDPPLEMAKRSGACLAFSNERYESMRDLVDAIAHRCFPGESVDAVSGCLLGAFYSIYRARESEVAEVLTPVERASFESARRDILLVHHLAREKVWNPPSSTEDDFEQASQFIGFYGVECARLSQFFRDQIVYGFKHRALHPAVTDVLQVLEHPSPVPPRIYNGTFKRPPLAGLMKAHFVQPIDLYENIRLENNAKGLRRAEQAIKKAVKEAIRMKQEVGPDQIVMQATHELSIGAYERRAARNDLTGEWIIYGDHGGERFYFGLGRHQDADVLYERLLGRCQPRFEKALNALTNSGTLDLSKKRSPKAPSGGSG